MKTIVPDYYPSFHCIADRCRHSCCIGWEIDVDRRSLERYHQIGGELGRKLADSIVVDECPHFRLTAGERCPFLNQQNLCELILNLGADSLCQICSDHPRFRNDFSDRVELGLGLCCEAAGTLILSHRDPVQLICLNDDGQPQTIDPVDQAILTLRGNAIALMQDRSLPVLDRLQLLLDEFHVCFPDRSVREWADFYLSLERLDPVWTCRLERMRTFIPNQLPLPELEIPLEQLCVSFLYRHLPAAQTAAELRAFLGFAVLSCRIIHCLYQNSVQNGSGGFDELVEISRLYSSEIEYSEDNTDEIIQLLTYLNEIDA